MVATGKILVVDDEPHIRRILQFLLEQEGYEVELAANGEQALAVVERTKPDLILLDIMMPKMDGFSVLKHLRGNFETRQVPVIMLTAKGESTEKVRGLRGGANDYLTKPFNQEELLLRMSNMLEVNRAQREANPLTGLPGNRAIERETLRRVSGEGSYGIMYIDIDRFKSFNDHYGYQRGDQAISYLARVLRDCSAEFGSAEDFVGHVGGDDFVVITDTEHAENLARQFIERFDAGIADLHEPADFEAGYLNVQSRSGTVEKIPLITLTVALVSEARGRFLHPAQLSDTLAELKRYGKTLIGSVVVKERRAQNAAPELVPSSVASRWNG
jgi:diguanylate cyclase (GGDEF)-like protein